MFFKNKNEELVRNLEEKFRKLETGITEENRRIEEVNQNIDRLRTAVKKHDMAIEDLLEVLDEKQSENNTVKERFGEYEQSEHRFLEMFEVYQDFLYNLKKFADKKDETLSAQIILMEKKLEHYQQLCGLSIIRECGVKVNYDLHEVIETVDTEDFGKDKLIADIYSYGYIYKGKVKKKAKIAAYYVEK